MPKVHAKDWVLVSLQLLIFVLYFLLPSLIEWQLTKELKILLLVFSFFGLAVCLIAVLQLNKNLTPFPSPVKNGELIQTGLYKFVRHPIYGGLILFFTAYALYAGSLSKLLLALLLFILFHYKSIYEESLLEKKFNEYQGYMAHTHRFFPFL